ncbi:uncharacterized protein LOC117339468 isoform X2 [Pecten maximus]|uniref:uncharacterized protein LOC117339468 isoform X2 n=1 Tax=Pecten maximus TaxID=6579 RepID=UPI0014590ECA|nr:uncharacterized protein LOC117339468 isoform X2 [Pecten maximus]XP_033756948.1 uncharacterized protein LOC117339468 isoform X2 [Pecten maximus]
MAPESNTPDTDSYPVEARVIVAFSVWQFVIVVLTLGVGIVAIGRLVRVGCKNCTTIIVYLLCGLLHELYAIYILQTAKQRTDDVTVRNEGCADFYFVCLVAIVISLLVVSLSTVRKTFAPKKAKLIRNIALVYTAIVVPLAIKFKSLGSSDSKEHLPTLQLKSEFLYVTVCERDPYSDGLSTLLEYGAIYFPFSGLYLILYYSQRARSSDKEMKFSELQCLPACQEGDLPYLCRTCTRVNPVLAVTLIYYIFAILMARPFYIGCSMVLGTTYKDLLPNITITALYVFVSLYCTFDIYLFPKKSTPVKSDSVTEILIETDGTHSSYKPLSTKTLRQ